MPKGNYVAVQERPKEEYIVDEPEMNLKNCTFCLDSECPAGRNAKCGKKHEEDFGILAKGWASN